MSPFVHHPFHCGSFFFPLLSFHTAGQLVSHPRAIAGVLSNVGIVENPGTYGCSKINIPRTARISHTPVNPVSRTHLSHPGINSLPTGNRLLMTNNPATESSCTQGCPECEELSFAVKKCKSSTFSSFCSFLKTPGYSPRERTVLTGNHGNNPEQQGKPGIKLLTNPPITRPKPGIPP